MRIRPLVSLAASTTLIATQPLAGQRQCIATPTSMTPAVSRTGAPPAPGGSLGPLRRIADVPLPGPANRFDYQSIDPVARRLYISHMNAGRLVVVDLDAARVVADVPGVARATGG